MKLLITLFSFLLTLSASQAYTECLYVPPVVLAEDERFFHDITLKSYQENETFASLSNYFEENAPKYHQFVFRYPIGDAKQAAEFSKVLQIKAQQAHHFVPVIESTQFIDKTPNGFEREIKIQNGPHIVENVAVDKTNNAVMFFEVIIMTRRGVELGCFTACNRIEEIDGEWFFTGTYLYFDEPSEEEVTNRIEMFDITFDNMMLFMKTEKVDAVYSKLISF